MQERWIFLFPGQGAQKVGMGRELADAFEVCRETFEQADEALGFALSKLCWEGPQEELQLTENTQPAILTVSVAAWRAARPLGLEPSFVAGHSLGEYSALVAAGALDFADAVRLVRQRGRLMQEAVPVGEGAMAAVLGPGADEVAAVAAAASEQTGRVCTVANLNAPGQTVIAGHREAVDAAVELAKERGARRSLLLPVSAPFHSPLMAPAREGMTAPLAEVDLGDAAVPVVCNVDARPIQRAEQLRDALVRQIDGPVRWVECVEAMVRGGATHALELGPGSVLSGLNKRIHRELVSLSVGAPEDLEAVRRAMAAEET